MTNLLEDVRPASDRSGRDAADPDAAGCWTKLLDDTSGTDHRPTPIMIAPAAHPTADAAIVKDLLVTVDPETGKTQQTIDGAANGDRAAAGGRRRESILGTFHRQLRMSLKAVSETPGPLQRYFYITMITMTTTTTTTTTISTTMVMTTPMTVTTTARS
uniref:Uncharacterized protein n=1 Tax=Anopheles farauti TaxID=69004 RepID=A0A182QK56_9DIPT